MFSNDFIKDYADSDGCVTADDILKAQEEQEKNARELMPYNVNKCSRTHPDPIRQTVFSCRTCHTDPSENPIGVCSACAISCHADHELVEVFEKRNFVCDCGRRTQSPCTIYSYHDPILDRHENAYGHNFEDRYCICDTTYDPDDSRVMIQCYICEDWFHEDCLNLDLSSDDYDILLCKQCMKKPDLRHWLGPYVGRNNTGVMVVHNDQIWGQLDMPSSEIGSPLPSSSLPPSDIDDMSMTTSLEPSAKKIRLNDGNEQLAKKQQSSTENKLASPPETVNDALTQNRNHEKTGESEHFKSQEVSSSHEKYPENPASLDSIPHVLVERPQVETNGSHWMPEGKSIFQDYPNIETNVYLQRGFRKRWCTCGECKKNASNYWFLIEDEPIYKPPEDPDLDKSTFELALEALDKVPRDKAAHGAVMFQRLSEKMHDLLRMFAESGQPVTEDVVRNFFRDKN